MSSALEALKTGEPREANVADLTSELDALARSLAQGSEDRNSVTRACALTLLVYADSEEAGREVSGLLGALTLQNPCRAVILVVRPDETPAGLSAWISTVCQIPAPGEKQVCCEHVTIVARGDARKDLDKVVVPLMVSGLPVNWWWRSGQPTQPEYFEKILPYVDRVVLDSERFSSPEADFVVLARRVQKPSGRLAINDLNWARLTLWRELAAQCFDSPDTRPYLQQINAVRIEYNQHETGANSSRGQALLFAGWLASRLGWEPAGQSMSAGATPAAKGDSEVTTFLFKSRAGEVCAKLVPRRGEKDCASGFLAVELKAASDSSATFSLACGGDRKCVITSIEIPGRQLRARTVRLEVLDEIGLLNEELKLSSRDRIYEEVVTMVASMKAT